MASIPCTTTTSITLNLTNSCLSRSNNLCTRVKLNSCFIGGVSRIGRWCKVARELGPSCGSRTTCWFNFRQNAETAGVYGSQNRDDFDRDDVEQYFNYMGMLAVEGTYDKMEALLSQNIHPVDILLLLASTEGDLPKIEELLRAGADYTVKDADGRTALERAANDDIKNFIVNFKAQKA
ncbi:protein LHCP TRANSLOCATION DEFECT [Capsicum chacoense]|uniref:Protein LHCP TRANSLOCATION DEFECT n=1 Tax=Capsicum annuum TaxID=4072 RepID=A0A1U8ENV2_CAPAN|nr:protein LHCP TRANSLOCATION DEFECT [Capsicum annuum]KAF3620320.1 Protein LHCP TRANSLOCATION DEFECT [Capsicum annuum]KAF3634814.1 Protein LHCP TRANSLOCATION DEFECT [Capsicum annuum]PHT69598.1 Protein LHCP TRANSLOCATION DEFECT [Capsicum annuum]